MQLPMSFDQHVVEMKRLGDILIPYNYPVVSIAEEDEINILKIREVVIDGYSAILHFNKSFYEDHHLSTLQIIGRNSHFLPFSLVCKIAKRFLGEDNLSLIESIQDNRKVYSWNLVIPIEGQEIKNPYKYEEFKIYEGLKYRNMSPKNVNFY